MSEFGVLEQVAKCCTPFKGFTANYGSIDGVDKIYLFGEIFENENKTIFCNAWAQIGNASVRFLVFSDELPYSLDTDDLEAKALTEILISGTFQASLDDLKEQYRSRFYADNSSDTPLS